MARASTCSNSSQPGADNPLVTLPNIVLGPHVAEVTEASMEGMALACVEVIDTVLAGKRPAALLDPEVNS